MGKVSIDKAGSVGLVLDPKPDTLPPEAWNNLNNIRVKDQGLQSMNGDGPVYNTELLIDESTTVTMTNLVGGIRFMAFGNSGNYLYILSSSNVLTRWNLGTPYDLSTLPATASQTAHNDIGSNISSSSYGFEFSDDGAKLYYARGNNNSIFEWTLASAWDIATAPTTEEQAFNFADAAGIKFNAAENRLLTFEGSTSAENSGFVRRFSLSSAADLTTLTTPHDELKIIGFDWLPIGYAWNDFYWDETNKLIYLVAIASGDLTAKLILLSYTDIEDLTTLTYTGIFYDFDSVGSGLVARGLAVNGSTFYVSDGNKDIYEFTLNPSITQTPRFLLPVRKTGDNHWLWTTNGKAYKMTEAALTDVTKLATTYGGNDSSVWSGLDYHRHQILNIDSGSDLPQVLLPGAVNFVDLTNWPASTYCKWINSYKNFLIAYNITEGATNYPCRVKWSDLGETGALPTTWDETDTAALAGENDELEKGGGEILCAYRMNDMNFIYKDNAIWYMYPRNDLRVFNFKEMEEKQGVIGSHAVGFYKNKHYCMLHGDVVENSGQKLTSVIDPINRRWLFNNLNPDYYQRSCVVPHYEYDEMWFCFPDLDSAGWLNKALVLNIKEGVWSRRELNNYSFLSSGIIDTSLISDIIDEDGGIIDEDDSFIDEGPDRPFGNRLMAALNNVAFFFRMDDPTQVILGDAIMERQGLTVVGRDRFNDWRFSAFSTKQVTRVFPKLSGGGTFNISVGFSAYPDGPVTWSSPEVFTVGGTPHVDFLNQGIAMAIRIEPTGNDFWSLSGWDYELNIIAENTI